MNEPFGLYDCPDPVGCMLHDWCYLKVRHGAEACAPYPGTPNYPVPAIVYVVERRRWYMMITCWRNAHWVGWWNIEWWGAYKYEDTRM